ncbi:NeuD/PglB/VioB family sugar acetyltransferase [Leptospira levettii]|uniref:NeuD/PglB/VioB family sugar acetyltransferase n=1 Tax=Leptospira levettii TaxID=2023178 RepID=UPI00223C9142|nr:NeuD/PglB/VioB family sugar acetyltransferase [Leptospira levettii]MCW7497014.1 NeuD/PglB/VioB family sugar acetyltransferase [Leptospira levettii]
MEGIILIGGGGHCKSVIDVIQAENRFSIIGIIDSSLSIGSKVLGIEIMGDDSILPDLVKQGYQFHITIGQIKTNHARKRIADQLLQLGAVLPNIISPFARVSAFASLGVGVTVMHGVTIQSEAQVGDFTIINDHALLEHEVKVGKFCHIATGAIVNGNVKLGDDVFVGSGSVVIQGSQITNGSFLKAKELYK